MRSGVSDGPVDELNMDSGGGIRAELGSQCHGLDKQRILELLRIRRTERASHLRRQEIVSSVRKTYEDFVQKASGYAMHWRVSPHPSGLIGRYPPHNLDTRLRVLRRQCSNAMEKQKEKLPTEGPLRMAASELATMKAISETSPQPLDTLLINELMAQSTISSSRATPMSPKTACSSPTLASSTRSARIHSNLRKKDDTDARGSSELPIITQTFHWHPMAAKRKRPAREGRQQMTSREPVMTSHQRPDTSLSSVDTHTPSELRALSLLYSQQTSTTSPCSSQTISRSRSQILFNSWEGEGEAGRLTEFPLVPHTFPKPPVAPKRSTVVAPLTSTAPTKGGTPHPLQVHPFQEVVRRSCSNELDEFSDPSQSISKCFLQLRSDNWKEKLQGLRNIKAMAREDPNLLQSKLHEVFQVLGEEVNKHSTVACEAIDTISALHEGLGRAMDRDTESKCLSLLMKCAQITNKIVQQQEEPAADAVTDHSVVEPDNTEADGESCPSRADVRSKPCSSASRTCTAKALGGDSPRASPKETEPPTRTPPSAQHTVQVQMKTRGKRPGDDKGLPLKHHPPLKPTNAPKKNQAKNCGRPVLAYGEAPSKKRGPRHGRNRQFQKGGSRSRKAQQAGSPSQNLALFFQQLSSDDWNKKLQGLKTMKALARRHPGILQAKLHQVCRVLGEEVGKLQLHSIVACEAINTIAALHRHLGKAMDQEAEMTGRTLLMKLAHTNNKLIHLQVNLALEALVKGCSPAKVLSSLVSPGLSHWCPTVRISTAKHLHQLADIVGEEFILTAENMVAERYLRAVSKMAIDGAAEVRIHGREMLRRLDPPRRCRDLWVKIVPYKDKPQLDQVLTKILWRR
ncbi:uncharacterized protein LOC128750635 isoform X2 [Synchiropus splendidus]|uniref:uncharacterized protein LOC128750635 isoform X2 n=1 Tax=Synchiropus splendidus TaxID=270530 RepID=UPI00237EDC2A|nr:uncharacterized protein LOC128750635 isoform X2 [Synchiropus splendidus]